MPGVPNKKVYKNTDSPEQGAGGSGTQTTDQTLPVVHVQSNLPAKLEGLPWATGLTPIFHGVHSLPGLVPKGSRS